ncbi:type IV pilus modification protein PilV [Aquabacterium sp.]|uniref:type IV pilus modification protein PilV n=1 Tax=Aquabacterium sp. TaxID=1872578 RepID=UPI0019AAC43B|nr:type IV pilus modification protein PilV [Aquabacterium sp.]MBC7699650.1 type IV pilus modification protein PilV [Aquabacterium sp.]
MSSRKPTSKGQQGATLIEVLVSMLVISLGILAMVILQLNTTKYAKASEYRAIGALLASDLTDRMRANRPQETETAGNYAHTPKAYPPAKPNGGSGCDTKDAKCSTQQIADKDVADWLVSVYNALPQGEAFVSTREANGGIDLWLIWTEPNSTQGGNQAEPGGTSSCPTDVLAADAKQTTVPQCMHFRITDS